MSDGVLRSFFSQVASTATDEISAVIMAGAAIFGIVLAVRVGKKIFNRLTA